jgi:hypothetical protein
MSSAASIALTERRGIGRRLAAAALTVAALDFSYVFILWVVVRQKVTTTQLLQSIATGLLGKGAYDAGTPAAVLGGMLHLSIALIWCLVYLTVVRLLPALRRVVASQPTRTVFGLGYGVVIWWCMDLIVLPLSRARPVPFLSWTFAINSLQHACMVGLPIALILRTGESPGPA